LKFRESDGIIRRRTFPFTVGAAPGLRQWHLDRSGR
jgi:hypothetical protein